MRLQLRNLQCLVELGVDKNTTVVFPRAVDEHHRGVRLLPRPGKRRRRARGVGARACPADLDRRLR